MRRSRAVALAGLVLTALVISAVPAGATVTGPCDGSATWPDAKPPIEVVASQLAPGEVVIIPLEGDVSWTGAIAIPPPSEARDTSGNVKVKVPFPVGTITVGTWATSGTKVDNSGTYEYEFPSILSGFEVTVTGEHWEGNLSQSGPPTCSGEVTLALEGTNPIGFIAGGLTVVSIMGVYLAIRVKGPAAGGSKR
ncbi:MAG: hypothetical protein QNJ77_15145 [Acidimicrobiia bacterium]|nr:hypothetical protein [Acidimicrobiia bacterium]